MTQVTVTENHTEHLRLSGLNAKGSQHICNIGIHLHYEFESQYVTTSSLIYLYVMYRNQQNLNRKKRQKRDQNKLILLNQSVYF